MSTSKPPLPPEVHLAMQRGDILGAIKAMRAVAGLDLQAASRAIKAQAHEYAEQQGRKHAGRPQEALREVADAARAQVAAMQPDRGIRIDRGKRPPTVVMGDRPGEMRWVLIVVVLLGIGAWMAFAN